MLDSLLDGMKGQVAGAIAEKAGIDMGQAEQAVPLAGESIKEGIMGAVTGGNSDGVMSMLSGLTGGGGGGGMMQNMVFAGIAKNFIGKLTGMGLPDGIASTVSSMALPMIMGKIGGAADEASEGEGINAAGLMKVMGGGGGALGALGGLMGGGNPLDAAKGALGGLMGNAGDAADGAGDAAGDLADKAKDALKDKLGGLGGLLG
jgi:hypothetical protein